MNLAHLQYGLGNVSLSVLSNSLKHCEQLVSPAEPLSSGEPSPYTKVSFSVSILPISQKSQQRSFKCQGIANITNVLSLLFVHVTVSASDSDMRAQVFLAYLVLC